MANDGQAKADAALFLPDALDAARKAMSGNPDTGTAYLAVFTLLAANALFPEAIRGPNPDFRRVLQDGLEPMQVIGS